MSGEFCEGLLWLAIGTGVTLLSSKYNMGTVSELGPGALPLGLGLVLILLSICLLVQSGIKGRKDSRLPFGSRYPKVVLIVLLLVVCIFLLESLGYLFALFFVVAIAMLIMEPRRWVSALVMGVTSSLFSYLLFGLWLKVPLPRGLIHF